MPAICDSIKAMTEQTPVKELYGVGDKVAEKLAILGVETTHDLLYYFPRRYEDFTHPRPIDQLIPGEEHIIQARIVSIENEVSYKKHMKLTRALVADNSGQIGLIWFNQPFLIRLLKEGTTWLFAGKVERDYKGTLSMVSPVIEREGKVVPVYSETTGLTSKVIRKLVSELLLFIRNLPDWLPETIRNEHQLVTLAQALEMIHFPTSIEQVATAKKRLAFDELFLLVMSIQQLKSQLATSSSPVVETPIEDIKKFIQSLPFSLTDSQRLASWQILQDMAKSQPMSRLLEGDVGSGKTVVGAIAAYSVIKNNYRAVWMAPTEILANQHYQTCIKFLEQFNVKIGLLTGSTSQKMHPILDQFNLIIGTQAIIQDKVRLDHLGLIIVDEQHRFGVQQRARLLEANNGLVPHFLAMTATPIPRTLALTLYGDLEISRLETVPTGRKPIITKFVDPGRRKEAYAFIRQQIQQGRQAFVVCPLVYDVSQSQAGQLELGLEEKRAATAEYERLKKTIFPDLNIGLIHGKLKPTEKQEIMERFKSQDIDVLVATSVIEVGIDIPNAAVMMIEGADRFGLAQLHQIRGRVGRGEHQSYCFVFTDSQNPAAFQRLRSFADTLSGFEIAELDLQLRGPGQLAGVIQSGHLDLKIASLSDIDLIQQVKQAATIILNEGLDRYPILQQKLVEQQITEHLD